MTIFERWHGWHGRASLLVAAGIAVVTGFFACMAAPSIGSVTVMAIGLAVFGLGMGAVYTAALYYVLEVGGHGADAGGSHEALIGIGYTVGPAIGLAASLAIANGALDQSWFDLATALGAIVVIGIGIALSRPRYRSRPERTGRG
jgi:MFS family permease